MFKKPIQFHDKDKIGKSSLLTEHCLKESIGLVAVYARKSDSEPVGFVYKAGCTKSVPSLYMLWENLASLPIIYVNSYVSTYILSGAHLMFPGILVDLLQSDFHVGDLVGIAVYGSPSIFAVGIAEMSSREIHSAPVGMKGKSVSGLHYFGDFLWQMGSKRVPDGFGFDRIVSVKSVTALGAVSAATTSEAQSNPAPVLADEPSYYSTDQVDQLLFVSFLHVCKGMTPEKDLPMELSALYSQMQRAVRSMSEQASKNFLKKYGVEFLNQAVGLDVSKSSYKKFKLFIDYLENEQGLVKTKTLTSGGQSKQLLMTVNQSDERVRAYEIFRVQSVEVLQDSTFDKVIVTQLFSVPRLWQEWLHVPDTPQSVDFLRESFRVWLGKEVPVNSGAIMLKLKISTSSEPPQKLLSTRFNQDLIPHYSLSSEVPPRVRRGDPPTVTLVAKKIQKNKYATEIIGLSAYHVNEAEIAKALSKQLSVSCSVIETGRIHCQGRVIDPVRDHLANRVGIPGHCLVSK